MFGTWNDLERTFAAVDDLRRRFERPLDGVDTAELAAARWPHVGLWDTGRALVLRADLPGVAESDLDVQLAADVLTVAGARAADAPAGYAVHRQERAPARFARSFTLPCKVNPDAIEASLKDGVLTVTLPKAPESQPRQITVKAA